MKLREFKNKQCKTIFGKALQFLLFHHLTQIGILLLILLLSGIVVGNGVEGTKFWNFSYYMMFGSAGLLAMIAIISMIYGFIINPIRDRKLKK